MGSIILVTGGARSGKSEFAERYAAVHGKQIAYIATAEIWDEEMKRRVNLHRARRPKNWQTYEAPRNADAAIRQAGKEHDVILFDCLTLYLSNYLCRPEAAEMSAGDLTEGVRQLTERLIDAAREQAGTVIFVTNEVGAGIVPENRLARLYRDLAGRMNQQMAVAAERVFATICGLAVDWKKLAGETERGI